DLHSFPTRRSSDLSKKQLRIFDLRERVMKTAPCMLCHREQPLCTQYPVSDMTYLTRIVYLLLSHLSSLYLSLAGRIKSQERKKKRAISGKLAEESTTARKEDDSNGL